MKNRTPHLLLLISPMLLFQVGCEMPELDQPVATPVVEDSPTAEADRLETEPAEPQEFTANDPKKGKASRSAGGYLGAVFGARFWAEHQMIINNIKRALDLYNAQYGNYPKTHEEFMDKIIAFNQIVLPELDPGQEYIYDPEDHTLKFQAIQPEEELAGPEEELAGPEEELAGPEEELAGEDTEYRATEDNQDQIVEPIADPTVPSTEGQAPETEEKYKK